MIISLTKDERGILIAAMAAYSSYIAQMLALCAGDEAPHGKELAAMGEKLQAMLDGAEPESGASSLDLTWQEAGWIREAAAYLSYLAGNAGKESRGKEEACALESLRERAESLFTRITAEREKARR